MESDVLVQLVGLGASLPGPAEGRGSGEVAPVGSGAISAPGEPGKRGSCRWAGCGAAADLLFVAR